MKFLSMIVLAFVAFAANAQAETYEHEASQYTLDCVGRPTDEYLNGLASDAKKNACEYSKSDCYRQHSAQFP